MIMAALAAQDEYWPIKIARSDSHGYANLDHNALNPKEDQDVTQLERWEVILGGHLAAQLAPKDDSKTAFLQSIIDTTRTRGADT